jgi:hypothetical protein
MAVDQEYEKIVAVLERVKTRLDIQIILAEKLAMSVDRLDRRLTEMKEEIAKVVAA